MKKPAYTFEKKVAAVKASANQDIVRSKAIDKFTIASIGLFKNLTKTLLVGKSKELRPKLKIQPISTRSKAKEPTREQELKRRI